MPCGPRQALRTQARPSTSQAKPSSPRYPSRYSRIRPSSHSRIPAASFVSGWVSSHRSGSGAEAGLELVPFKLIRDAEVQDPPARLARRRDQPGERGDLSEQLRGELRRIRLQVAVAVQQSATGGGQLHERGDKAVAHVQGPVPDQSQCMRPNAPAGQSKAAGGGARRRLGSLAFC